MSESERLTDEQLAEISDKRWARFETAFCVALAILAILAGVFKW